VSTIFFLAILESFWYRLRMSKRQPVALVTVAIPEPLYRKVQQEQRASSSEFVTPSIRAVVTDLVTEAMTERQRKRARK
jgi:hypothetical protein